MHLWLQGFTLHFGHGPAFWIFIVFVMVTVVALTIAWKIRAIIRVNPVEALRDE
jgi:ABC-type antimicrobial peptide transport system permease subunit